MSKAKDGLTYVRIAEDIRSRIRQGDPPAGALLPSEAVLARTYGVARGTVRQAVAELERVGLVASEAGRGRRVVGEGPPGVRRAASTQYETVAEGLRKRIESGELVPGQQLPSEAAMAEEFGVSKGTVRQAFQLLASEQMIAAVHGRGWFVGGPDHAQTRADDVADALRREIASGQLFIGAVLPGENVLAQERGVARVTVRRALALLETEGVIEKRAGRGRVVTSQPRGLS
ncbi:DNA-binding GntR family transcriptional regulator [Nonomuraea muscovyensis]|uniref:DNA-binding GntR family transcriptional regulator n=1 Tax=Nonomuraea muscovyensis TaxID=1124761 RepID=A0A7X0F0H2_9ACTN|nr:GntR family transcriptional regulator [Nonomuraea muscovyensis]MBB6350913.1 DNA-binding GntR family transcriptional regulator [Nonomuraea muscovyensis]